MFNSPDNQKKGLIHPPGAVIGIVPGSLVAEIGNYSLISHAINSRKPNPFELDDLILPWI